MEKKFLKELYEVFKNSPREESYYPALIELFKSKGVQAVQLPKKTEAGFPDIKVFQKGGFIIGYIECKKPEEDIEKWENTEQVKRYKAYFKNFILTNFLTYKHFVNGKEVKTANLISYEDFEKGNFKKANLKALQELLADFLNYSEAPIKDTRRLAEELAWRVRLLKQALLEELKRNETLKSFLKHLRDYIIHTLSEEDFADTIAQSLAYALLIVKTQREFIEKRDAITEIPQNLAIVRDIFLEILKVEGKELNWIIDEITNTLNLFDLKSVKLTPEELTIHFYETFLKSYNPELREIRGVYYTPKPVVKFIVKSVEELLRKHFSLNGYFSEELKLLDPAGGTLTFILEVFERLKEEIVKTLGSGLVKRYFEKIVLKNFFAFELLPAPYVIGHLKVSQFLNSLGISKKFNFFLTNALEFEHRTAGWLFSHEWAREIQEADRIKREEDILVIIGNPPYSGISANNTKEINEFLKKDIDGCQSYYKVDGKGLGEKNPKWLQDDYVKFIRFAQWKIEKGKKGIVGYITNHSYIDNPTFRGMRQSLLKTFDEIYILDLHANKRKKEPDENVFDIQQGVAIGIFVKTGKKKEGELAKVYYYSTLKDKRLLKKEEKFSFLEENSIKTVRWKKVIPKSPYYFFKPVQEDKEYQKFWRIDEIFGVYSVGVVTGRDKLFIDFSKENLANKIATELALEVKKVNEFIEKILYRPFDNRYIFYNPEYIERARKKVMSHMLSGENLGLVVCKQWQVIGSEDYDTVFVSGIVFDLNIFRRGGGTLFPLYLYTSSGKVPNFKDSFISYLRSLYPQQNPSPEEVFYYIYAVLYSPTYREKYRELLKYEFPRIPFPEDFKVFKKLSEIGEKLVSLHLLKANELNTAGVKFEGEGDSKVEKPTYKDKRLYINNTQYFFPVEKEEWEYKIGGYQVLKKWLSDRKERTLSLSEIKTFLKIIKAIKETIKLQSALKSFSSLFL